jgi:hypothetical protein
MTIDLTSRISKFIKYRERHFRTRNSNLWIWIILLLMGLSIASDMKLLMWTDELFTLFTARLQDVSKVLQAIQEGSDVPAALYDLLVHFLIPVIRNETLAVRLPATLGFYVMLPGLFIFCRRRVGSLYAFIAAMLACEVCLYYATDGRAYGAVLGCTAWALVFWQRASGNSSRRAANLVGLGVCLSLMVAFHSFAVFFLGPLLFVEAVRFVRQRKLDVGILAAAGAALLVLAAHYPFIVASAKDSVNFWSQASLAMIRPWYEAFLLPILGICGLGVLLRLFLGNAEGAVQPGERIPVLEWIMLAALTASPAAVIFIAKYTVHGFVARHVLWAVVGMAALVVFAMHREFQGHRPVGILIAAGLVAAVLAHQIKTLLPGEPHLREAQAALDRVMELNNGNDAILVPDSHYFVELSYYAPPPVRSHIYYPLKKDTLFTALYHQTDLGIEPLTQFLAGHRSGFTLVSARADWAAQLMQKGFEVTPLGQLKSPMAWSVRSGRSETDPGTAGNRHDKQN